MTVTAETQAVLNARAAADLPEVHTLTAPEAREQVIRMRELVGVVEPEPVARVEDRRIPGPGGEIPVRVYWRDAEAPHPVVAYFHGGGWVVGDLESHDGVCRSLANHSGSCIVSVDYRLAPEHRYPAAAEDAYAATMWLAANASELGGDPSRLAVAGDSAGGNLAAVVALMARDQGGPAIRSQVLFYPVTDYDFETSSYQANGDGSFGLSESGMRWFWDCYVEGAQQGREPYASPLRATDLSNLPPALVVTAEYDPLRDEGEAYAHRLEEAGVQTELVRFDGVIHGFVGQAALVPEGRQAIERAAAHLKAAFAL